MGLEDYEWHACNRERSVNATKTTRTTNGAPLLRDKVKGYMIPYGKIPIV